jgi:hypothetical protein
VRTPKNWRYPISKVLAWTFFLAGFDSLFSKGAFLDFIFQVSSKLYFPPKKRNTPLSPDNSNLDISVRNHSNPEISVRIAFKKKCVRRHLVSKSSGREEQYFVRPGEKNKFQ